MQHIFMNNSQLCNEINERVVQHFVHCTETHGRHVQYLKFLQTIVKADNKFIKKCQDIVMAEVGRCLLKSSQTSNCVKANKIFFFPMLPPSLNRIYLYCLLEHNITFCLWNMRDKRPSRGQPISMFLLRYVEVKI